MDRRRKPAMRAGGGSTRRTRDLGTGDLGTGDLAYEDEGYDDNYVVTRGGFRFVRRTWALIRWVALILAVGAGIAFVVSIGVGALVTLLDSSV
jgi:hypothetical protein